jgi:multidrug efflux pump
VQDISNALNNAYAQRQVSTLYTQRNQYRVILEIDPQYQRDPTDLNRIYVSGANNTQVPLAAVTTITRGLTPLVVNHQGQFPAITVSFGLAEDMTISEATRRIDQAVAEMHIPDTLHAEFAGDARAFRQSIMQPLIIAALIAVYIVLGVLYELAHPLTIISTLPRPVSAAGAANIQHRASLTPHRDHLLLTVSQEERNHDGRLRAEGGANAGSRPTAISKPAERWPIMMTTMAARWAPSRWWSRPPGSSCGGCSASPSSEVSLVSQMLTLYTTPVIYPRSDSSTAGSGAARPSRARQRRSALRVLRP